MTTEREKIIAKAEVIKRSNDMFGDFSVALYHAAQEDERAKLNSADAIMQEQAKTSVPTPRVLRYYSASIRAVLTIEDEEIKGEIVLVKEVEPGQCVGCVFDTLPTRYCPKDEELRLVCSSYSAGRTGIYQFIPIKE